MPTFGFTIHTRDDPRSDLVERIYGSCDDATATSEHGRLSIAFDRQADTIDTAMRTAMRQVRSAGCTVESITIDTDSLAVFDAAAAG